MKLNCAEFFSKDPTEEMIVDLVRNNAKRGEFMILEADDGESFVQIAGEYDAVNSDARVFTLEYREAGKDAPLYHAVNDVTAAGGGGGSGGRRREAAAGGGGRRREEAGGGGGGYWREPARKAAWR